MGRDTLLGGIVSLNEDMLVSSPSEPQNVTLYENRVFTETSSSNEVFRVGANPMGLLS